MPETFSENIFDNLVPEVLVAVGAGGLARMLPLFGNYRSNVQKRLTVINDVNKTILSKGERTTSRFAKRHDKYYENAQSSRYHLWWGWYHYCRGLDRHSPSEMERSYACFDKAFECHIQERKLLYVQPSDACRAECALLSPVSLFRLYPLVEWGIMNGKHHGEMKSVMEGILERVDQAKGCVRNQDKSYCADSAFANLCLGYTVHRAYGLVPHPIYGKEVDQQGYKTDGQERYQLSVERATQPAQPRLVQRSKELKAQLTDLESNSMKYPWWQRPLHARPRVATSILAGIWLCVLALLCHWATAQSAWWIWFLPVIYLLATVVSVISFVYATSASAIHGQTDGPPKTHSSSQAHGRVPSVSHTESKRVFITWQAPSTKEPNNIEIGREYEVGSDGEIMDRGDVAISEPIALVKEVTDTSFTIETAENTTLRFTPSGADPVSQQDLNLKITQNGTLRFHNGIECTIEFQSL